MPEGSFRRRDGVAAAATRGAAALMLSSLLVVASSARAAEKPLLPGIDGADDRVAVDSVDWPWSAIGRLNNANGPRCTATLVARDAVVTAAHCLTDGRTGRFVPPSALHFVAGYRRGEYLAHATGRAVETGRAAAGSSTGLEAIAADWAIVRIQPPMSIRPIPLGALPVGGDGPTTAAVGLLRAGYSQDRPHMLAVHDGCRVTGVLAQGRLLLTDCDATRGDSGSPLLVRSGADVVLVGVTSAVIDRESAVGTLVVAAESFRAVLEPSRPER